jgi:hypothetical protein
VTRKNSFRRLLALRVRTISMKPKLRKHLCIPGLLARARAQFDRLKDPKMGKTAFSLADCLMSGLALFGLKYPSLLQFDKDYHHVELVKHNIEKLYQVKAVPSDTYFRERLDEVEPKQLQKVMDRLIAQLQRGKVLEQYQYYQDYYLVAIDGSGYFSSHDIHCASCCVKHHRDGSQTYYHQMLAAVLVHPDNNNVFPLAIEAITKQDGALKNDCEHTALKRLLYQLRRSHPHLKLMVTLDGLYADAVIIQLLQELKIHFIITAKPTDLKYCYEFYQASNKAELHQEAAVITQDYSWANHLPLNAARHEIEVNLLCYEEKHVKKQKEKKLTFAWITDLALTKTTVPVIMRGGRARWHIENQTFNTLKNQGYQFEHNFGHGYKYLSVVMAYLMFIAFLIDQIQEYCCYYFQAALKKRQKLSWLWEKIRGLFFHYLVETWSDLYTVIIEEKGARIRDLLDTS